MTTFQQPEKGSVYSCNKYTQRNELLVSIVNNLGSKFDWLIVMNYWAHLVSARCVAEENVNYFPLVPVRDARVLSPDL